MADGGIGAGASQAVAGPAGGPAGERLPRCASIVAADPWHRKLGLQAAVAAMAADGVEPVWVGNPLTAPMTLRRLLVQLGAGDVPRHENDEARLAAAVARRRDAQGRVVLVVSQAETLDRAVLPVLQRLASGPDAARVVFVGTPEFWPMLNDDELAPLRRALGRTAAPATPDAAGRAVAGRRPGRSRGVRVLVWTACGVLVLALLGGGLVAAMLAPGGLFYRAAPQRPAYVITAAPVSVPDRGAPSAAPTRAPAATPAPAPASAPASAPAPASASVPAPAAGSEGRVVIHYREGSAPGEAAATRLASLATPLAARVQTRAVPNTPATPAIRYFHPEDATRAHALAVALRSPDAAWDIKDFSSFRPQPSSGTVEVWIPSR